MDFTVELISLLAIGVVAGGLYSWRVPPRGANALSLTIWPAFGYLMATAFC